MAIWYLNMLQEDEDKGMIQFDHLLHQYWSDDKKRKAEVYVTDHGYGCRYYEDHMWKKDVMYKNHSESYAESAAENFVLGILQL
tara:strand:- start:1281 stop:1532 length:252 start_codon:yes stop_codon:yes gene_type:complete